MSTRRFWPLAAILFALPFLYFAAMARIADAQPLAQSLYIGAMNFFYLGLPQALIVLTCLLANVRRSTTIGFLVLADLLFVAFSLWTHGRAYTSIGWFVLYLPGAIALLALASLAWLGLARLGYATTRRRGAMATGA